MNMMKRGAQGAPLFGLGRTTAAGEGARLEGWNCRMWADNYRGEVRLPGRNCVV